MGTKKRLKELIEIEREHFNSLKVGSPEYASSQERLMKLEDKLADCEEKSGKTIIEGVKVAGGIILPVFGWVVVTAFEKNDSLTSSLKKTIDCFLPKRL